VSAQQAGGSRLSHGARRQRKLHARTVRTATAAVETEVPGTKASTTPDRLVRYLGADGIVSVRALVATEAVRKIATEQHSASPISAIALGRSAMAALLLANGRDEGEKVQLRIEGGGPGGNIIAEASSGMSIRAMMGHPEAEASSVPELLGNAEDARISVVRTHPYWKAPYTGTTPLESGEIAEDIVNYLGRSEETPSSMGLSVEWDSEAQQVKHAEGWLVTALPPRNNADEEELLQREAVLSVMESNIRSFMKENAQADDDETREDAICQHLMRELLGEFQLQEFPTVACSCSEEKVLGAVMMLGKMEVLRILRDKEDVEAKCEWCGKDYVLTTDQVRTHMKSEVGEEVLVTKASNPRNLKYDEEMQERPQEGTADWS